MSVDRQKHLDEECEFVQVKCSISGCNKVVRRHDLRNHQENCQHREIQCNHRHNTVALQHMTAHLAICDSVSIDCPYGCDIKFLRSEKTKHESKCPLLPIHCPMASVDCTFHMLQKYMNEHMLAEAVDHMELIGKNSLLETHCLELIVPDIKPKLLPTLLIYTAKRFVQVYLNYV